MWRVSCSAHDYDTPRPWSYSDKNQSYPKMSSSISKFFLNDDYMYLNQPMKVLQRCGVLFLNVILANQ